MSFLDADPDLTKPPQFTAYSSESAAGGRAPPKPRPTATPTSSVGGNSRHKGALFSDAEKKLLRYTWKICTCICIMDVISECVLYAHTCIHVQCHVQCHDIVHNMYAD